MQRDNIKAKNKKKIKKNDIFENNNNIINEDINEDNFNNNENENENFNSNEIENNNFNDNQNENNQQNFIEEEQFQGQNAKIEENNNYNEVNDEENKNQEEIIQDNENPSLYNNKNNLKRNKNQLKEIPKKIKKDLNNNQISDTKSYSNEENNKDIQRNTNINKINEINDNNIKAHLQNMFNEMLYNSFDEFEKNISFKLNEMNRRLNDISLKISDIQAHPNNINNTSKKNKDKDKSYSVSSYKPQTFVENNTSFYINSKKMKINPKESKDQSVNTEEPDYNYNINKNNLIDNNIDSEVTKEWKETLKLIEKGYINEGYLKLINSGDDIYLLRLICLTGPVIDKLDVEIAKRVLIRVNMISKSHQIQQLLISLIKNSIKNNVFQMLDSNQQNYILDSLYEFSGLNNSIASEAAELYAELTK